MKDHLGDKWVPLPSYDRHTNNPTGFWCVYNRETEQDQYGPMPEELAEELARELNAKEKAGQPVPPAVAP